jgi:ABC-type sulfate transport system permease component
MNGVQAGIVIAVTSIIITIVQIVPSLALQGGAADFFMNLVKNWGFWASLGLTLLAATAAGSMKK